MTENAHRAMAIVAVGAVLPDASTAKKFWENIKTGRYSISEVDRERWDPAKYWDEDPSAPDKTYSKIGGWVRDYAWDPMAWKLPVPPRVADAEGSAARPTLHQPRLSTGLRRTSLFALRHERSDLSTVH